MNKLWVNSRLKYVTKLNIQSAMYYKLLKCDHDEEDSTIYIYINNHQFGFPVCNAVVMTVNGWSDCSLSNFSSITMTSMANVNSAGNTSKSSQKQPGKKKLDSYQLL